MYVDVTFRFGDRGYRDALCAFIAHAVTAAEESRRGGLRIQFPLGAIIINPEPADLTEPKIAQLHIYDPMNQATRLMVWRPGEDIFASRQWL